MDEAREATRDVLGARDGARELAVRAVRALERATREALGGEHLRGLSDLAEGACARPYKAARVNAEGRFGIDTRLPVGRRTLVWTREGRLAFALLYPGATACVVEEPVFDEDLRAEDLERIALSLAEVLGRHARRVRGTAAGYRRARDLAERIADAVGA